MQIRKLLVGIQTISLVRNTSVFVYIHLECMLDSSVSFLDLYSYFWKERSSWHRFVSSVILEVLVCVCCLRTKLFLFKHMPSSSSRTKEIKRNTKKHKGNKVQNKPINSSILFCRAWKSFKMTSWLLTLGCWPNLKRAPPKPVMVFPCFCCLMFCACKRLSLEASVVVAVAFVEVPGCAVLLLAYQWKITLH